MRAMMFLPAQGPLEKGVGRPMYDLDGVSLARWKDCTSGKLT